MRIHTTINERTLRRTFREQNTGKRGLTVLDKDLPAFGLKVSAKGTRTFFVRVVRKLGAENVILGTAGEITAAEAREKAMAEIETAKTDRVAGPLMRDFADEFLRRQGRRWKLATRRSNGDLLARYILPFFGAMRVADITRADVQRWFDSMSATPGNANRALPVLSVMLTQAELWDIRSQGSKPCRNMNRYQMKPRERFLFLGRQVLHRADAPAWTDAQGHPGRFPEMSVAEARKEAAATLARLWTGQDIAPARKVKAPLFRDFAVRYRQRRKYRWKPSSLKTYDIYMKNRIMPFFGKYRLDRIDHARVSDWFDAVSASKPGAANRAFEILRAVLATARQWGELGMDAPDACANIVMNRRKPIARYLNREELERLGAVLDRHSDEHPWPVAAIRLLTLTGARLSEVLNLRWDEIGEPSGDGGGNARLEDSKTGPRTLWLGPEAAKVIASLPRREGRVFPKDLTSQRLYAFWTGVREEAGLSGLRIHDCRHTWASQGVMNGVGLATVGRFARTQEAVHHRDLCPSRR